MGIDVTKKIDIIIALVRMTSWRKACLHYGLAQPSRPHSDNLSEERRVRKKMKYNAAPPSYISPVKSELEDDTQSGERPEEHLAPST
jgi:hypothetical protein